MLYLLPFLFALYVFILVLLTFKLFGWTKKKTGKRVIYGVTVVIFIVASVFTVPAIYKQTLDKVDAEVDLFAYAPFEKGTKAVKIDEPGILKLAEDSPILTAQRHFIQCIRLSRKRSILKKNTSFLAVK